MTPVPPIPIERYLVPATSETPPELQEVDQPLVAGLPATIPLTKELSLVLALPTGLAQSLRELDADVVITEDTGERRPYQAGGGQIGSTERAPARLFLLRNGTVVGSAPLVAGVRRRLPEDGDPDQGSVIELVVERWSLLAGTVLGVGDFGSRITFAWREIDQGADSFLPPPIDPNVISRLRDRRQTQSLLGAGVKREPSGYETAGTGSSDDRKAHRRRRELETKRRWRKGELVERAADLKREQISEKAFASQELR